MPCGQTKKMRLLRTLAVAAVAFTAVADDSGFAVTPSIQASLDHISAVSMRGNLSFLASDAMQGRATPSRELDIAAEFIASRFREIGLEPAGDDGYFQTAKYIQIDPSLNGFRLQITAGAKPVAVDAAHVSVQAIAALDLKDTAVVKIDPADIGALKPEQVSGKVVAMVRAANTRGGFAVMRAMDRLQPALLLIVSPEADGAGRTRKRLVEAGAQDVRPEIPVITVVNPELAEILKAMKAGESDARLDLHLEPPARTPVTLKNVAGILRGSDASLKDTYEMVTAHYDHIGVKPNGEGDRIYNGANDDGSGTVSVIEIASALAGMHPHPRRSILFVTFFGEEMGLVGSRYYGRHPLVPLDKTIADVNLEQVGRVDATNGNQTGRATFTGYAFSDLPQIFAKAGEMTGIKVYNDEKNSDPYFARSDNQMMADLGVPAHTLCVAFDYPDYHGVGDHWDKIDYDNMAKTDRMVALGLIMLADRDQAPQWNAQKAKKYEDAYEKLHPKAAESRQ